MKRLLYGLILLITVAGCVTDAKRTRMRSELDSINVLNRANKSFTTKDVEPYILFFDDHGTPNDSEFNYILYYQSYKSC